MRNLQGTIGSLVFIIEQVIDTQIEGYAFRKGNSGIQRTHRTCIVSGYFIRISTVIILVSCISIELCPPLPVQRTVKTYLSELMRIHSIESCRMRAHQRSIPSVDLFIIVRISIRTCQYQPETKTVAQNCLQGRSFGVIGIHVLHVARTVAQWHIGYLVPETVVGKRNRHVQPSLGKLAGQRDLIAGFRFQIRITVQHEPTHTAHIVCLVEFFQRRRTESLCITGTERDMVAKMPQ